MREMSGWTQGPALHNISRHREPLLRGDLPLDSIHWARRKAGRYRLESQAE